MTCSAPPGSGRSRRSTGAEGIELAGRHLPDVVLMDLGLPDTDGASAARALGAQAQTARIPVVALTALPQAGEWFREAGFAGYLEKPFDIREFAAIASAASAPPPASEAPGGPHTADACGSTAPEKEAGRVGAGSCESYGALSFTGPVEKGGRHVGVP